ncbi:preprotein translocase subunit SecG [Desulfothermus okinawensis]
MLTIHFIACIFLIILILLQSGHEGMGVIFGGPSSSSFFGSSGAGGFLVKMTVVLAIVFFCTSLGFTIYDSSKKIKVQHSVILEKPVNKVKSIPAVPVKKKDNATKK